MISPALCLERHIFPFQALESQDLTDRPQFDGEMKMNVLNNEHRHSDIYVVLYHITQIASLYKGTGGVL